MDYRTEFQRTLELDQVYFKGSPAAHASHSTSALRIVSWNIARGEHPDRIAQELAGLRPDIVCLQEVDWGNRRTGTRDVLEDLARLTGMRGIYAIEFLELEAPGRDESQSGGGVTGNAVLTRIEPKSAFRVALPPAVDWQQGADDTRLPPRTRQSLRSEPRLGARCGLALELRVGQRDLVVCSAHLEDKYGGVAGRWAQYMAAVAECDARGDGSDMRVIAGDFNTFDSQIARFFTSDTEAMAMGKPRLAREAQWWHSRLLPTTGYRDPFEPGAWTFRVTPFFRVKLDWLTARNASFRACGRGAFASSDHRPIWADIEL